ncbi:unnamed protein product [Owenia fusiformis]|uniref:Uncharacterized protein n=1 Tax=Owenia fusiformis TaxID=6347 RepID=A0A8J1UES5_OWEFU|nr:unnamed protein product [Owenia fusiformis]
MVIMIEDTHKDMTVSRQDFFELLKKTARIRQWKTGSPGYKKAAERLAGFWSALMTGNKRYRNNALQAHIKLDEWLQYWSDFVMAAYDEGDFPVKSCHRIAPVSYAWHTNFLEFLFELMDVSGDGVIDKSEFTNCFAEFSLSPEECGKAFDEMSKDGEIKKDEFAKLWYQYLTSTEESDPGNSLLGKLYTPAE